MICVLDYGAGNLKSIEKALKLYAENVVVSTNIADIENADGIVLPGVGAFRDAMKNLGQYKRTLERTEKLVLGICLGMQVLFEKSYEGGTFEGLGLIRGEVKRFEALKVPQIGWNTIEIKKENPLLEGIRRGDWFYFVHSYYCSPIEDATVAETEYGTRYCSVLSKENIYATQFHPEKSSTKGLRIIKNFVKLCEK